MTTTADTLQPLLHACREGRQTLLVSGRSLSDLHVNERGEIRPLKQTLFRQAKEEFGMASLIFSLAEGPRWDWTGFSTEERAPLEQELGSGDSPLGAAIRAAVDHSAPPYQRAFLLLSGLKRSLERS
ncbi:MAG: hypothetical protein KDL87_18485, partial [Verrucomicrobiae bacterium]|nr:hypothetical protein [Verrucomicrobiae bacterium]